jgi:restriction endonuclease S subunit
MNRYQSYKPSGVEWIGEIPEHWETIRFGMLGIFSSSGIDKKLDDNETSVRMVNYTDIIKSRVHNPIINNQIDFMVVTTPQSKLEEHKLRKGDLVFLPSSETCEDLGVSSLIDFDENDIVYSYHILRFKFLKEVNHYFKKYLGNHNSVYNQFSLEGKGTTRQIIGRNVFRNVKVVLPPISEQLQIVQFLDEKTELIDKLISTKERKITLLKEQRTSLINEVVTKGLNPNVKMKNSGVEWIGEIPENWGVFKMKYGVTLINEKGLTTKEDVKISPENVESMTGVCFNFYSEYEGEGMRFKKGDILLNKLRLYLKKIVFTEVEGYSMGEMIVLRCSKKLFNRYFYFLIFHQGLIDLLNSQSNGVKLPRVSPEIIMNSMTPFPPLNEQFQIVEHLDSKTKEINDLVHVEQKKIDLLKEYRQSLISEVVIGKIKVTTDE